MGGLSFCDPRADSQDVFPPKVPPSGWPGRGTFRWWVHVSGPAPSQSRKALARLAEPHQLMLGKWAHGERDKMGATPSAPAPLMARSHGSVEVWRRLTSGKAKRREKRVSLIYGEPCFEPEYPGKQLCVCGTWYPTLHFFLFSALLPCFFFFFFSNSRARSLLLNLPLKNWHLKCKWS